MHTRTISATTLFGVFFSRFAALATSAYSEADKVTLKLGMSNVSEA
jgi:hypothetical protein